MTDPENKPLFLGMVEVDSGTLVVGDPCYMLPRASHDQPGVDYEAVVQAVTDAPGEVSQYLAAKPVLLIGSFGGDGSFPVYGELDEYGELVRVTIEFVYPDDDDVDADEAG